MGHLTNIRKLGDILRENDIGLDNAAYMIDKKQGDELAKEIEDLSPFLLKKITESSGYIRVGSITGRGWKRVHGGMFDGVRILVHE